MPIVVLVPVLCCSLCWCWFVFFFVFGFELCVCVCVFVPGRWGWEYGDIMGIWGRDDGLRFHPRPRVLIAWRMRGDWRDETGAQVLQPCECTVHTATYYVWVFAPTPSNDRMTAVCMGRPHSPPPPPTLVTAEAGCYTLIPEHPIYTRLQGDLYTVQCAQCRAELPHLIPHTRLTRLQQSRSGSS